MDKSLSYTRAGRILKASQAMSRRAYERGLTRQLIEDDKLQGDSVVLDGRRVVNFGLCSYLGLGDDERLIEGAVDAIRRFGTSYSSSMAYTAVPLYRDLSERLATILEAHVVLAPTTTLAHLAALPVLIRPEHVAVVDAQSHASVRTATQILQANGVTVLTVPHDDLERTEATIAEHGDSPRVWLLTDGVFSMHGDIAPAVELNRLLDRHHNLYVYCDDAHGFGWDGEHGRGVYLGRAGWHERLVISVGLSKSFGATGGVIATVDEEMAEMVEIAGPPLVFGGPIPPAALGAGLASADIHLSDEHKELQRRLMERIDFVNRFAEEIGLPLADHSPTPLWYHDVGDGRKMLELVAEMKESGFFLNAAAFPVVPVGHAGVRFTVTNYLSMQQIEDMMICLQERRLEMFGETEVEIDLTEADAQKRSPAPRSEEAQDG